MADQATGLLSKFLRRRRIRAALPHIAPAVLDVGCAGGALSAHFSAGDYAGLDIDGDILRRARELHPGHTFLAEDCPPRQRQFRTVALLAVIEHVPDPVACLKTWKRFLVPDGRMVLTTPHPSFEGFYNWGSRMGLFSPAAQAQHQALLDKDKIAEIAAAAGMEVVMYRRFLAGANQLVILRQAAAGRGAD